MKRYRIIEVPSNLGLKTTGVELLPAALRVNGFMPEAFRKAISVPTHDIAYNPVRDPQTKLLNGEGIATIARRLADTLRPVLEAGEFPIVLGGDCSILPGPMLALKQRGRYGLLFVDAHADFYQPEAELNGEVASMDLAIVTGRGPDIVANINNRKPYVLDTDVVHIGQRDQDEAEENHSQRIQDTAITCFDLQRLREEDISNVITNALHYLQKAELDGYWTHLDVDALDDENMPAVDYRLPGGLTFDEWVYLLQKVIADPRSVGVTITIFNPKLDTNGQLTRQLVELLNQGFAY
ncbi:arginase [Fibrisoma limi BUZ 3]|uniref:Arginase n=1 Tax=Fibrisoma limi BUZ 3 TaxID=1185876 RepID=I2GNY8_9BACT|nr:arginase family protein [Fibrisoma limi]CCH55616.1 arginase [Fibrisoma limi BUZ 3]